MVSIEVILLNAVSSSTSNARNLWSLPLFSFRLPLAIAEYDDIFLASDLWCTDAKLVRMGLGVSAELLYG